LETLINRTSPKLTRNPSKNVADRLVERTAPAVKEAICGKLEYAGQNGSTYLYREVGAGCIWVYLTDCNGNIDAGMQHNCVPGNTLTVEGCHAFGCNC